MKDHQTSCLCEK